jgi:hypothetical protein
VTEAAPAGIVTEPGTVKTALLLARETAVAALALPLRVTVQVLEPLAAITPGEQTTDESRLGMAWTVTAAVLLTDPRVAVTAAFWSTEGLPPTAEKAIEEVPAATVTEPGTVKAELLLARATGVEAAAFPVRVTAQVLETPADRVAGLQFNE